MDLFVTVHRWEHLTCRLYLDLTIMKLITLIPCLNIIHVIHPLISSDIDISAFLAKNEQFLRIDLHFSTVFLIFSSSLSLYWLFNHYDCTFVDVSKIGYFTCE